MASAEQPLKKRKLHEQPPPSPQTTPPPQSPLPHLQKSSFAPPTPPPLSQEEILRRRRSQEEIRNVFECYKRIKLCIDQNDKRFMPDLEKAYLSLISASRGGTSLQRLVAEYIPRYASYCPTALEAAAKVVINMHNCSSTVTSGGEDVDAVAFETAKTCILGLVDICQTAAFEAPTSAVIQGICSTVFLDVFTFFISSFEGRDIFEIVDQIVLRIHDVTESFSEFKQKFLEEDNSALVKLSKLRVLCFLRIYFSCPKNSIAACFDLFDSAGTEGLQKGNYFLRQLIRELNDIGAHHLDGAKSSIGFTESKSEGKHIVENAPASKNCLLQLVLDKDLSIKSSIFSRYKKLRKSASSEVVSDVSSILEGVLESFAQQIEVNDSVDGSEDISSPPKYLGQYLGTRVPIQQGNSSVASGRDRPDKLSGIYLNTKGIDPIDGVESKSMNSQSGEPGDLSSSRTFMPRDLLNRHSFSPRTRTRTPLNFRSNSFNGISNSQQVEKSLSPNLNPSLPSLRSPAGPVNPSFESSKHNPPPPHPSASHVTWYSDGDPASMAIFPASEQLWLGSLGPDASEVLIRVQLEKFGPIDELQYFPFKGFAFVKYRNIMDALKAREVMQGCSPWGDCLLVKFLDIGLGTKGAIDGVAIGSSCHVYVGNVPSKWAKDEMMHEVKKILQKGPRLVTDLNSEGALLMEFDSPEEATVSMVHMRWHRKGNNNFILPPSNVGPTNVMMHTEGARPTSASTYVDMRNSYSSNSTIVSPHAQRNLEKPCDSYMTRTSGLSSLLFQLRAKYNITHPQGSENNRPGASMRDHEQVPSSMLSINIPNISPTYLTDDELLAVCNLAINQIGSVVRLSRTNMPMGAHWFVECNSVDTANTLFRNLRDCPGIFFQIEFSHSGKHHFAPPPIRSDNNALELSSPKINQEIHGPGMQSAAFQSNWTSVGHAGMLEVGRTGAAEQRWVYGKPETVPHGQGSFASRPAQTPGTSIAPQHPLQGSANMRPVYVPPNSLWDARGLSHHLPPTPNPIPSAHNNLPTPPFLPASVTPLAQIQGSSMPQFDQMFPLHGVPPPLSSLAPPLSNRVDSDICNYSNAMAEPIGWPAKLDMTKRTDFRHVKSTFSSTPPHRREICWLLPSSQGDHKGFQDFIAYLKQRECAGVIKIPVAESVWARLLFILPYSPETCSMLSIPPNPSLCLIGLVLPKEMNSEAV
ncbi:nucleic acid binding [Abeliophyllum distichum]|uniref:Nucleic acid binding n=1 Tax=Abeliophyllum distichum TaxID=126358 RepID=A0ABD1SZB3_9LAMI